MYNFKNIDEYTPLNFERIGTLRGKRWYTNHGNTGLFKPRRFEYGDRKVFCANHYGEFMGYVLANALDLEVCPVELAHLTNFYEHYYKFKYNGTPYPRDGAISYRVGNNSTTITPGKVLIEKYSSQRNEINLNIKSTKFNDQIVVVLDSIAKATEDFYHEKGYNKNQTQEAIDRNVTNAVKMIVYDCAFGNNDRHDENWSVVTTKDDIRLYPLYDNERVLGLCENQKNVTQLINNPALLNRYNIKNLSSRMYEPNNLSSSYKDVLDYMAKMYPDIVLPLLHKISKTITPNFISSTLDSMEGLPKEYVELGRQLYAERYFYINQLISKTKPYNGKQRKGETLFIPRQDDYTYEAL